MGVRIEVREGESVEQALRRFRELVRRFGPPGAVKAPRWHKKQLFYYLKPSVLRRRKELLAANETYRGECARRHLVAYKRFGKHRRVSFAGCPIVG
jgi:ribosomal protein S21